MGSDSVRRQGTFSTSFRAIGQMSVMWIQDTRGLLLKALICGATILALPSTADAQDPVQRAIQQRTGQQLSREEILNRLGQSGLSREQVKQQLVTLGYDPSIADPYFDRLEGDADSPLAIRMG